MNVKITDIRAWMSAQYDHISSILNEPIVDAGDAARFIRAQGGKDMLLALERALQIAEQNNIDGLEKEAAGEVSSPADKEG